MSVYNKVRAVEKVFRHLDKSLVAFRLTSGMYCVSGCGKCCQKPDIEATALEFLPLAYYLQREGRAMEWYEALRSSESSVCSVYSPLHSSDPLTDHDRGSCGLYAYRGLICRLFGFAAARDKYGDSRLVTCPTIKNGQPEAYSRGREMASRGNVIFMRDYYFQLAAIDPDLGTHRIPINNAIRQALEHVMGYYAYRTKRA